MNKPFFKETQTYFGTWVFYLNVAVFVIMTVAFASYLQEHSFGLSELFIFGIPYLVSIGLHFVYLGTRIDEKGICYKFFPLHLHYRAVLWEDVKEVQLVQYDALGAYAGWGIRQTVDGTQCFTITGMYGILLQLKNNKKMLIGTKKTDQLRDILGRNLVPFLDVPMIRHS